MSIARDMSYVDVSVVGCVNVSTESHPNVFKAGDENTIFSLYHRIQQISAVGE